ncbi:MAG: fibronectin type III domain-containing protein, partial [Phycisphaerae bacterium]
SSGSPLFDQNHRIVGQLHGGFAACGNNDSDWYGRFSVSWNGGGTPSSRLRDWLDAAGTGAMTVDFVSLATLCSTAGVVELDRPRYACEISARITVVDCDLNRNGGAIDTVTVDVLSDSEPSGETVVLQETGVGTARFEGTIALSATDAAGVLAVAEGDQILVAYVDADDGAGGINVVVTGTAVADCTPPIISNVQATNLQPRSATVTFTSNELVRGTVRYGLSCGALTQSATGTDFSPGPSVDLAVLDGTTYFFAVEAEDEAGNVAGDDNGGLCYTFTTPDVPDYFTQQFNGDLNLDNTSILFTPDASADRYAACREPVTALPIDPAGGTILSLGDDESALVTVSGREPVWLYGVTYRSFFVNSNGNITFGSGDTTWDESLSSHFDRPRLSPLFDDFDPSSGGIISWRQLADRVAVTWQNVPEFSSTNANTFQVELFFDGSLRFSYLTLDSLDGITGLSEGNGVPPGFLVSDLSVFGACQIQDCNGNGVPDEQELDCQPNGVPDDCDIAAGTSADCNLNAVPDSCDIAAATLPDVNGNGVPDMCECPPAVPQPEVVSIAKNRYLSLSPGNVQQQTALRVTFVDLPPPFAALNGSTAWVGAPEPVSENGGSIAPIAGFADFNAATLSCTPVFLDWAAVGTVHVWHRAIIPGGVYAVQAIDDACDLGVE